MTPRAADHSLYASGRSPLALEYTPTGIYYPFMSGKIKPESPLGKLLATKGITPANSNQFEGSADW